VCHNVGRTVNLLLGYVHSVSYAFPLIAGIRRFAVLNRTMRTFVVLMFLGATNMSAQFILGKLRINNHIVADYYRVFEVTIMCAVIYASVRKTIARRIVMALGILFVLVWIVDLFYASHSTINSTMAMYCRLTLLVVALIALQTTVQAADSRIVDRSIFWISAAATIYNAGSFAVLAFGSRLVELGQPYFTMAWNVNWALLTVANLMYTKAILCKVQP